MGPSRPFLILIVNSHDILIGDKEFQFITKISDYSIIPADTLIVELEYTPKANMDHYASIVFLADNYDGSFSYYWKENTVEIFCDAQSFETIDPVFETKLLCEESESSFDIINKSKTQELTLYFDKISIIGTDKDYFHFKNDSPEAISPTLKKSYNVVFSGSETRLYSAQAIIPTSTGIDAKIELKASSLKIDFFAKPEIKIFETGKYFVADFYVNIPNVTPKFIDTLSLKLIYNSDVINIQLKDIIFELATNKDFNFNVNEQTNSDTLQIGLSGDMEVNKEYKVFSIKCLGLYTDIDTSLFKGSVVYPCVEDTSNLILLQREKICYDEARRIKISSKVTSPISVNPNPSNGFIELTFESAFDKIIDIDIYNSENRNVKNIRNFQAIKGANRVSVNVSDLPSGSYLLMVKDYKNIDQFKIIIE